MGREVVKYQLLDGALFLMSGFEVAPVEKPGKVVRAIVTLEKARPVLLASLPAIDRCLAAAKIGRTTLDRLVSPKYAANIRRVARKIGRPPHAPRNEPAMVKRARDQNLPMRVLLEVAAGDGEEEQMRICDALALATANRYAEPRKRRVRRPAPEEADSGQGLS